jgi:alpha-1,3-rhamnosyl/mannosyltransferase
VVLAGAADGATLAALYARSRLVAYVPVLEGFGLPVVEAMSACTPVVASAVPSAGGAAREIDPLDAGAIADALVEVATDDRVRSALVTAGLLRAGELTWAAAARRHVELWGALVR